jgi:hypothetical protein
MWHGHGSRADGISENDGSGGDEKGGKGKTQGHFHENLLISGASVRMMRVTQSLVCMEEVFW